MGYYDHWVIGDDRRKAVIELFRQVENGKRLHSISSISRTMKLPRKKVIEIVNPKFDLVVQRQ